MDGCMDGVSEWVKPRNARASGHLNPHWALLSFFSGWEDQSLNILSDVKERVYRDIAMLPMGFVACFLHVVRNCEICLTDAGLDSWQGPWMRYGWSMLWPGKDWSFSMCQDAPCVSICDRNCLDLRRSLASQRTYLILQSLGGSCPPNPQNDSFGFDIITNYSVFIGESRSCSYNDTLCIGLDTEDVERVHPKVRGLRMGKTVFVNAADGPGTALRQVIRITGQNPGQLTLQGAGDA